MRLVAKPLPLFILAAIAIWFISQGSAQGPPSEKGPQGKGEMPGKEAGKGMNMAGKGMRAEEPELLYPELMSLPEITPERKEKLLQLARQRMQDGSALMTQGIDALSNAAAANDLAAMQKATADLREGLAQLETGLAAERAITEGKAPRNEALQWFKSELNLLTPVEAPGFTIMGMKPFHSVICAMLFGFGVAMVCMYFFKMRRAAVLLENLALAPAGAPATAAAAVAPPPAGEQALGDTDACVSGAFLASDQPAEGLLPLIRRKSCNLKVSRIYQETPEVKTFRMIACHDGPIPFSYYPGQFMTLTLPVGDKPIKRSYTISSSPTQGFYCEISVKREEFGQGSRYMHDVVKVGDELDVQAPNGRFTFTGKEADSIVLIAGGVGITPMMSITRAMTDMGWSGQIYFLVACREPQFFIFRDEIKRLQERNPNIHLFVAASDLKEDMEGYQRGRLTKELMSQWVPDLASKRVHICGSPPMMDAVKQMLAELGVPKDMVHSENFGSMQKPQAKVEAREQAGPEAKTATAATVTFQTSGKSAQFLPDETVLEASERIDVNIDYSCRVGMCGVCRVKCLSGQVTMEAEEGLEPGDKEAGLILACQAKSTGNVTVEA